MLARGRTARRTETREKKGGVAKTHGKIGTGEVETNRIDEKKVLQPQGEKTGETDVRIYVT